VVPILWNTVYNHDQAASNRHHISTMLPCYRQKQLDINVHWHCIWWRHVALTTASFNPASSGFTCRPCYTHKDHGSKSLFFQV